MTTDAPEKTYYSGEDNGQYARRRERLQHERGSLWRELSWWQLVTVLLAVGLVASGAAHLLNRRGPTVEIKYVRVNQDFQVQILAWEQYKPTEEEIKADLLMWMRCFRSIPTSREVLERCWQIVPMFLLQNTHAYTQVSNYFKQIQPGQVLWNKGVEVRELQAFLEPDGRWRIEWVEDIYALSRAGGQGKLESTTRHTAILIVTRRKPTKGEQVYLHGEPINPRGVYITAMTWS